MGNGQHHLHPYIQLNTRLYIRIGVYCIISTLCIVIHRMFPIYYPIWEIFNNLIHSLYTVYNVHCMLYNVHCMVYIVTVLYPDIALLIYASSYTLLYTL